MSKYRVKQVGDVYYPQYKFLGLFWMTFEYIRPEGSYRYNFGELDNAIAFIRGFESEEKKTEVTIHPYKGEQS